MMSSKFLKAFTLGMASAALIAACISVLSKEDGGYIASYSDERFEVLKSELIFDLWCNEKPDPLKYLLALDEWGYLDKRKRYGGDGIGCFPFTKDFEIEGHKFLMICGYDNSELWRTLNSTYFERLPFGTNPPDYLALITQLDAEEIHRWEKKSSRFGYRKNSPSLPVAEAWLVDPADLNLKDGIKLNAIECSRYD